MHGATGWVGERRMTAPNQTTETIEVQGTRVPRLGFGTWQIEGSDATEAVRDALEIGYRQIDTARAYGNEAEVGAGIAGSGVDREGHLPHHEDLPRRLRARRHQGAPPRTRCASCAPTTSTCCSCTGPTTPCRSSATLAALTELREAGRIRNPGRVQLPGRAAGAGARARAGVLRPGRVPPVPGPGPSCWRSRASRDLLVTAYSPLAHGRVPGDATLAEISEAHGKTPARSPCAGCSTSRRSPPSPKASSHERRVENFEVFDFALSDEERARIDALPKNDRQIDPDFGPDWGRVTAHGYAGCVTVHDAAPMRAHVCEARPRAELAGAARPTTGPRDGGCADG